jgi:hypothetical protein
MKPLAACAVAVAALIGCDKPQARKAIVLNPTTRQTPGPATGSVAIVPTPATLPAATQVTKKVSHMQIGRMLAEFPDARLLVRKEGDKFSAFLVSNDPPEVLNPNYQGNRYYFEMALDSVGDIKNIAQADYVYKAGSAEEQDTPNGIFLNGDRQHLQPYDIRVVFDREGDHLVADLRGTFINAAATGEFIPVMARLAVKAEMK